MQRFAFVCGCAIAFATACSSSLPTAPTSARMTLSISQASLPIGALSGPVSGDPIQVRVGEPPPPEIIATPQPPALYLSCQSSVAGTASICMVSSVNIVNAVMNWGDGSAEQSIGPTASSVVHIFGRSGAYTVTMRGVDRLGQVVSATAIAMVTDAPAPPPPAAPPVSITHAFVSQEADIVAGCAVFSASATAASGTTVSSFVLEKNGVKETDVAPTGARVAVCGLVAGDVISAKVTDSSGGTASYPIVVK